MSYKVICRWLMLVLGLEVPRRGLAANQGQLLLVPGLWATKQEVWGMSNPDAACLRDFRNV